MRTCCCLLPVTELSAHLTKLPPVPFPRKAQESQKEMKLLLDMYKSAPKEQRDKVQLMAAERKAKAEVRAGGAQSLSQGLQRLGSTSLLLFLLSHLAKQASSDVAVRTSV